jgi:dTDP-4-amino-4,6-dideoxygalactose transaminase
VKVRDVSFTALGGLFEEDDVQAACETIRAAASEGGSFFPLPEETDFQGAFARHEGAAHAVVLNSCGTALDTCMRVLEVGRGDEVITTPLTFVATAGCAAALGARIVFADVCRDTLNLDPAEVEGKITSRTRAIIPVHFAGLAADLDAFDGITDRHGIPVIYDAAHAVGASYRGRSIGGAGKASCYSFQSNKNMTCLGEGGMITTDDPEFSERARQLKTFGYVYGGPAPRVVAMGFNYRMTKPQLAVGLTQLAKIDRVISERLLRFGRMNGLLQGVEELILPQGIAEGHGCHLYVLRLDTQRVAYSRETYRHHLKDSYKVDTVVHYPLVWSWEAFRGVDHDRTACPLAERAAAQVLSLPIFPTTSPDDLEYIAWALKQTLADLGR